MPSGVVDVILDSASTGTPGDGIVAVVPLENVWRVRSRALADPDEL